MGVLVWLVWRDVRDGRMCVTVVCIGYQHAVSHALLLPTMYVCSMLSLLHAAIDSQDYTLPPTTNQQCSTIDNQQQLQSTTLFTSTTQDPCCSLLSAVLLTGTAAAAWLLGCSTVTGIAEMCCSCCFGWGVLQLMPWWSVLQLILCRCTCDAADALLLLTETNPVRC